MPRKTALKALTQIEEGGYSHIVLNAELNASSLDARDRGLTTELVYGVLTWRRALDNLLESLLDKGLTKTPPVIRDILRLGAYQIVFLDRIPASAAVNTSVELANAKLPKLKGLVNSVLRRLSEMDEYVWWSEDDRASKPVRYLGDRYSLPNWLANLALQKYGGVDRAAPHLEAYSERPSLHVRLNQETAVPEAWTALPVPDAFITPSMDETLDEGLRDGLWSIQDLGAQLICWFAGFDGPSLDACAGLGGKSLFFARQHTVTAVEPAESKINLLRLNADRAGLSHRIHIQQSRLQDAPETTFENVLLDAPCTALGVIRRHPETRWTRKKSDVKALVDVQHELLEEAFKRTAVGGTLVYAVCTFSPQETHEQVANFLRDFDVEELRAPDAPFDWAPYLDKKGRLALNPKDHGTDGFYAARFKRLS